MTPDAGSKPFRLVPAAPGAWSASKSPVPAASHRSISGTGSATGAGGCTVSVTAPNVLQAQAAPQPRRALNLLAVHTGDEINLVADFLKKGMVPSVYEQRIAKAAARTLKRLDARTRQRIRAAIDNVAVDPQAPNSSVQPMRTGGFRLRVGDWRVLYDLNHSDGAMVVQAIRPRGGAYRP